MSNLKRLIKYDDSPVNLLTTTISLKQYYIDSSFSSLNVTRALLDIGSTATITNMKTFQNSGFFIEKGETCEIGNAANQKIAEVTHQCRCNIIIQNIEIVNCKILIVSDNVPLSYSMIVGLDTIRAILPYIPEIIVNNSKFIINMTKGTNHKSAINALKLTQTIEPDWITIENDSHKFCNFDCDEKICQTKICDHKKYDTKNSVHFSTTKNIIIPQNEIALIYVTTCENGPKIELNSLKFQINWKFQKYLKIEKIAHNQFDGKTLPIQIVNTCTNSILHIPDNTKIICGHHVDKIAFIELNHIIEFQNLPKDEQKFHKNEFQNWLENRKNIIKTTEFESQIASVVENADHLKIELKSTLQYYNWVFSRNSADIGLTNEYICELEFKDSYNGEPLNKAPYRMDPELSLKVDTVLDDMMKNDVIEICNSSYNTALLAVRKANGQIRLVQDYSKTINPFINLPNFPIPNSRKTLNEISDHISHVKNAIGEETLITSLDLKSGFHIIPMRKSHRKYLAFKHKNRQYTWKRMAMGPKNSPSDFCAIMTNILGNLDTEKSKILVYLDDILILSAKSDAINALSKVLDALSKANMFINLQKCSFFNREVKFLGYLINQDGFRAISNKLQKIVDFPIPSTLKQAHMFTGLCAYYTRYIPKLQILLAPLHKDIAAKGKFKLSHEAKLGIENLQKEAQNGYNLEHIDWTKDVFVCADTSLIGIGCCMGNCTINDNTLSDITICGYASRSLDLQESLLSSKARECIGASWALEAFEDLLHKSQKLYLICDHLSMSSIFKGNPLTTKTSIFTRFRRAIAVLLEYNIEYIYLPNNHELVMVADGLSRNVNYEKEPLKIFESELGLNIQVIHDLPQKQINNISVNTTNTDLPIIPPDPLLTQEDLLNGQKRDPKISEIHQKLIRLSAGEDLFQNGKTYTILNNLVCIINSKHFSEILVPQNIAYQVVEYLHYIKDHASFDRLIFFINKINIHIPGKYKISQTVVAECYLCQLSKPKIESKNRIENYNLRPSLEPFSSIRADLMDFSHSEQDFNYILTLLDTFSLFLEIYFISDKKATTVARQIALYSARYGLSGRAEITTDLGTEFINKNLEHELSRLNVTKLKISGLNPCSNRIERAHQEVKRFLRTQLHKRNWDLKFKIEMSVNKYNNTETKFLNYKSPFFIIHGWEPDILSSIFTIREHKLQKDTYKIDQEDISDDIDKWCNYHDAYILEIAKDRFQSRTLNYDALETKIHTINVNDIVACKFPQKQGECSKFRYSWRAPFVITSKNLNSYRIECIHTRACYTRNGRLLKKLQLNSDFEEMLRKRNFVVKENHFYPTETLENSTENFNANEVLRPEKNNPRKLRSGKIIP